MLPSVVTLVVMLATLAGCVALQVYLSRRRARWCGLILPAISLLLSLVTVLSLSSYGDGQVAVIDEQGQIVSQSPVEQAPGGAGAATIATVFLTGNIPTLILLGIYGGCRSKFRKEEELRRMQAQDLE